MSGCTDCGSMPADVLAPIWLQEIEAPRYAAGAIALDPREACYVVANGALIDGRAYSASFHGWPGRVMGDGRIAVRLDPVDGATDGFLDSAMTLAAARETP